MIIVNSRPSGNPARFSSGRSEDCHNWCKRESLRKPWSGRSRQRGQRGIGNSSAANAFRVIREIADWESTERFNPKAPRMSKSLGRDWNRWALVRDRSLAGQVVGPKVNRAGSYMPFPAMARSRALLALQGATSPLTRKDLVALVEPFMEHLVPDRSFKSRQREILRP